MKYALIDGVKSEATKGADGVCPSCESALVARCGEVKVHHWAHKGNRNCDPWWENETPWHRAWKAHFPAAWQEVIHRDSQGEKHIADVKTQTGWVLEFQHSYLKPDERRSRDAFYKKLVWVVDGTRRKTDIRQFRNMLEDSTVLADNPPLQLRRVMFPEECRLLREWQDSRSLIFFDFQDSTQTQQTRLWALLPKISNDDVYVCTFPRRVFIDAHTNGQFDKVLKQSIVPILTELVRIKKSRQRSYQQAQSNMPRGVDTSLSRQQRRRRRF